MALQKTKWTPDTCDCVVEYTWDDSVPDDQREHTLETITQCADHDHDDDATSYDMVLHENMKKNQTVAVVVEAVSDTTPEEVVWNYDANRQLTIDHPVQDADPAPLQTLLDEQFGVDEVKVV